MSYKLTAEFDNKDDAGMLLNRIANMIMDGYTSGISNSCDWNLE